MSESVLIDPYSVPRTGVVCVVVKDYYVLMYERWGKKAAGQGLYAFPGGHLEMWETFEECANRERDEECGDQMKTTGPRFWTARNVMFPDVGKHFTTIFMTCRWVSGEPMNMEPDKGGDWEWHHWDRLPSPVMPGIQMLIDDGECPIFL